MCCFTVLQYKQLLPGQANLTQGLTLILQVWSCLLSYRPGPSATHADRQFEQIGKVISKSFSARRSYCPDEQIPIVDLESVFVTLTFKPKTNVLRDSLQIFPRVRIESLHISCLNCRKREITSLQGIWTKVARKRRQLTSVPSYLCSNFSLTMLSNYSQ